MSKYKDIIGRIQYGLFLTVVALLPFPQIFLRYACVLWLITWYMEFRWIQKPSVNFKAFSVQLPFMMFGIWYAWKAISGFWAPDYAAWSWQMERYMIFALLIPVAIWGLNQCYDWRQIGKVLVFSCVAAVPLYVIWMTILFYHPEFLPHNSCWQLAMLP